MTPAGAPFAGASRDPGRARGPFRASLLVALLITAAPGAGVAAPAGDPAVPPPASAAAAPAADAAVGAGPASGVDGKGAAGAAAIAAAPGSPARPEPIPLQQIPRAIGLVMDRLRDLHDLPAAPVEGAARRGLTDVDVGLARLESERGRRPLDQVTGHELLDWRQDLLRLDATLEDWETGLERQAATLRDRLKLLQEIDRTWEETSRAATEEAAPAGLLGRVAALRGALASASADQRARLDAVLSLLTEVSDRRERVAQATHDVESSRQGDREQVFRIESAPLWSALLHPPRRLGFFTQMEESWRDAAQALERFAAEERTELAWHAVAFVLLLLACVLLRPRVARRAREDPELAMAARLFSRPVSAALLVALILTFWIHPRAPVTVHRLVLLLMAVPLLRLLPGAVDARLLPRIDALAGLYCFDRLVAFASPHSLLYRVLLLVVTLAGAAFPLRALRTGEAATLWAGRRRRVAIQSARAALLLFLVSAAANVVGNVGLAELLTRGVLGSGYGAVALYAATQVLASLWAALLVTPAARNLRIVLLHGSLLRARGIAVVRLAAGTLWGLATLAFFGLLRPLLAAGAFVFRTPLTLGSVAFTLGDVGLFVATLLVAVGAARFLAFVLDEGVLPRVDLPRGVGAAITRSARYVVIGLGIVLATLASGMEMSRFAFVAGALGVGIGFGLQNVVNNFVSGLILMYERPIQYGDVIEIGSVLGEVRRIGVRSSTVRTGDGAEVILPNASLISDQVTNWTLSDRMRRIEVRVGVAYGSDTARVVELLLHTVRGRTGVLEDPAPAAQCEGFGASSLDFVVRFWTGDFDRWGAIRSDVLQAIDAAFRGAGIEIPFPQRDLRLRHVEAGVPLPAVSKPEPRV